MKKNFLLGSLITSLSGVCLYFAYQTKLLKDCKLEGEKSIEEKDLYLKSIFMMDKLLEAEDLFNQKQMAESINVVNEINSELLTGRARDWLNDLEKEIRRKGKV